VTVREVVLLKMKIAERAYRVGGSAWFVISNERCTARWRLA
jgi:hypothetical protein